MLIVFRQQAAARLEGLLNSGQYSNIMQSLGLPQSGDFGVEAFLKAIAEHAAKEQEREKKQE